jgi:hypothetical protein
MIVAIAAFAVLLVLEKFLFDAAVRTLTSPTEHVIFGEAVLVWAFFNGSALVVLGPIVYAMKVTDCFTSTPRGWAMRLRLWANALIFASAGTVIGVVLGFAVGLTVGYAVDPGSNPHNYDGFFRLFVTEAGTVVGAVAGAVAGFVVGLVRTSRRSRSKAAPGECDGDLA